MSASSAANGSGNGRRSHGLREYSAFSLVRHGLRGDEWAPAWRSHDLKSSYDVVIIGGGVHGLAAAYHLATNHGITDVLRDDRDGVPSYLLHCERSSDQYLFDTLLDAGAEYGIEVDGFGRTE